MAQPSRYIGVKKKMVSQLELKLHHNHIHMKYTTLRTHRNTHKPSVITLCQQGRLKGALQDCLNRKSLPEGKLIHSHMIQTGIKSQGNNKLVSIYAKCGNLKDARKVLDQMSKHNVVAFTVMIAAYAKNGLCDQAMELFYQMQKTGVQPNQFTFSGILSACKNLKTLRDIHEEVIRGGFETDVFVGNGLIDMYAKCGCVEEARELFDKMPQRDVVSWNAMIGGYTQNGHVTEALELFERMPERSAVSWNVMIAGCAQNGHGEDALKVYRQMRAEGVKPNLQTFASVLQGCANLEALEEGMKIHDEIIRSGIQCDVIVESALVDLYAKCGRIEKARDVFDKMCQRNTVSWTSMISGYSQLGQVDEALELFLKIPKRDLVSWTAIIAGYAQNGYGEESLRFFHEMQVEGMKPDSNTFASVLPACADLAALEKGIEIHEEIVRSGLQSHVFVANALIDMYAKCGSIKNARDVFDNMPQRNVVSWNAMIAGYAMHGCGREALVLFEQMQHNGMNPNHLTFVGVLSACRHAGLVDKGFRYFECMSENYHITPTMEHYSSMVDLLGRAGHLDEAHDFINRMPINPDASVWGCLLGACTIHNNIELGERVAKRLFELDHENDTPFVALSNIYSSSGKWYDSENVWKIMKVRKIKKKPGCSWIEVNKQVFTFFAGDESQPQQDKIYPGSERLPMQMKVAGYVPDIKFALNDLKE